MDVIQTERLVLRWMTTADAELILELVNDPDWLRYIGDRGVRTLDDAREYILSGPGAMYSRVGFGLYLVETRRDRVPIGICGLLKRDALDDVDLGFALLPRFRGQGYAYEAAAATLEHGRRELALERIVAVVAPENETSIHLLERLGMRLERTLLLPGQAREVCLFGPAAAPGSRLAHATRPVHGSLTLTAELDRMDVPAVHAGPAEESDGSATPFRSPFRGGPMSPSGPARRTSAQMVEEARARVEALTPEQVAEEQRAGALLVDVRETEERSQSGSIAGAVHAPRGMLEFWADPESPYHRAEFDPSRRTILHCAGGARSALAADLLQQMGYSDVAHLEGGIKAWTESGQDVQRDAPGSSGP